MVEIDAEELVSSTATLSEGSDTGLEDEKKKPWWEVVKSKEKSIMGNMMENRKCAERLHTRVRFLHEQSSNVFCWIRKFEDFYNIVRWDYREMVTRISKAVNCTTLNLIRVGVNAVHSMIGKEMPKIGFVSDDGDYDLRESLKLVDRYIEAEFENSDLYRNVRKAVRDGALCKLGTVKVWFDDDSMQFRSEHIPPRNLLIDDADQMYDRKNEVFERKLVSKYAVIETFNLNEKKKKVLDEEDVVNGKVVVYEAWYKDYCHVVFTKNCVLHIEELAGKPPFFHWRWTAASNSFWGVGIADEGWTIQDRINDIDYQWVQNGRMFAVPKVLMSGNARFSATEVTNKAYEIIKIYGGGVSKDSVQWIQPSPMNPQHLEKRRDMVNEFMQQTGLSQFMSTGQREAGIYSGETARVVHSIQSSRFAEASQSLTDMYVDIARYMVRTAALEFSAAFAPEDEGLRDMLPYTINWSEVDIENNYHRIKQYPMNIHSMDMQARLKYAHQMMQLGVLPPQDALEVFQLPDIRKYRDLITSGKRDTHRRLNNIMKGEVESPNPMLPTYMQYVEGVKFYNEELTNGLKEDDERAKGLRKFIDQARASEQVKDAAKRMLEMQQFLQAQANQGPTQKKAAPKSA